MSKKCTCKLSGGLYMSIYTVYIGRYVTKIWTNINRVVYQCDGCELDEEGKVMALKLKYDGYELADEESEVYL